MRNWFYSRTCHRLPRILKAVTTVLSSGLSKSQVCLPLITVILASIQWSPLWSDKIYLTPPKGSVIFLSRLITLLSHWNWHVIPVISFAPPPPPPLTFPPQGIKNDQSLKLQYVLRFTFYPDWVCHRRQNPGHRILACASLLLFFYPADLCLEYSQIPGIFSRRPWSYGFHFLRGTGNDTSSENPMR